MTSQAGGEGRKTGFLVPLRAVARIAVAAGAVGSFALMLRAGHRNNSRTLLLLFAIWVLSPFIALVFADVVSRRWRVFNRATLYGLMLVLTVGSLAIYGDVALGPPRARPAAAFLVVPLASWLLIAIAVPFAGFLSRRHH